MTVVEDNRGHEKRQRAAKRARRFRARKDSGEIVIHPAVQEVSFVEALVTTGRVSRKLCDLEDDPITLRQILGAAAARVVADWSARVTRDGTDPLRGVSLASTPKE